MFDAILRLAFIASSKFIDQFLNLSQYTINFCGTYQEHVFEILVYILVEVAIKSGYLTFNLNPTVLFHNLSITCKSTAANDIC